MVKLSNKGKGRPTKRRTLKTKFKIEKRVKQYRKKVKKQAKKLKQSGIRHKRHPQKDVLPNLFPFKQQMLQQFKDTLPKEAEAPIQSLNSAQLGLVTMQNKPIYFPKPRDNLTKKYITNLDAIFKKATIVLQVLDCRNPQICIDQGFRTLCKKNKVQVISVLTKIDTLFEKKVLQIQQRFTASKQRLVKFTHDSKHKKQLIQELIKAIQVVKTQMGIDQTQAVSVFVAGKQNTGKHTLISSLCKYAGKYQDIPSELFELVLIQGVKIIDAPYRLEDKTNFPLFNAPSEIRHPEQSLNSQEQTLLKYLFFGGLSSYKTSVLSRNQVLEHYLIQDYTSIEDLCKKIGKSTKIFGKGGMIDVSKVRNKILCEWFQGKLNKFINPMNSI